MRAYQMDAELVNKTHPQEMVLGSPTLVPPRPNQT